MDGNDPGRMQATGRSRGVADRVAARSGCVRLLVDELVGVDAEGAAIKPAVEEHPGPRPELVGQPTLVEPDRGDHAGAIGDGRLDDAAAALPHRPRAGGAHGDHDRRGPADRELRDVDGLGAIGVAVGDVLDQVPERDQPDLRRGRRELRPDAADRSQQSCQVLRMRNRPQRRGAQLLETRPRPRRSRAWPRSRRCRPTRSRTRG